MGINFLVAGSLLARPLRKPAIKRLANNGSVLLTANRMCLSVGGAFRRTARLCDRARLDWQGKLLAFHESQSAASTSEET